MAAAPAKRVWVEGADGRLEAREVPAKLLRLSKEQEARLAAHLASTKELHAKEEEWRKQVAPLVDAAAVAAGRAAAERVRAHFGAYAKTSDCPKTVAELEREAAARMKDLCAYTESSRWAEIERLRAAAATPKELVHLAAILSSIE